MAIDSEFISSEGFNLKFKNYLRDFFVYQFKERGSDFKSKGTNDKSNVNKNIIDSTFYPDAKRLQYALEQSADVHWTKGDYVDLKNGKVKVKKNKRVECITVDSRRIASNPFFSLYQFCSESALMPGTHFLFVYVLLMYFQLGKNVKRTDYVPITSEQEKRLNIYLKRLAENIESELRRHKPKFWEEFSDEDKEEFALKAIERFSKDHYGLEDIYNHIILNKKQLAYTDDAFILVNDDCGYIEKSVLFDVMQQYNIEVDEKQFSNKIKELTRLGVIKSKKEGQKISYALSDVFLDDLLGDDEEFRLRFSDCVFFFAQTSALGEIGTYIQNRLPQNNIDHIRFKHNYLNRALNDYNNIDLLYAIKNNLWAIIEYRNASLNDLEYQKILCYPIEIRESVTDGRQYLVYYHPVFRSVSAVRVEFIDSIVLGTLPPGKYFNNDMLRAKELIKHTWGTAFDNFREGNVKIPFEPTRVRVIISFDENENFIKARLKREIRHCASFEEIEADEYGRCLEIVAEVTNPREMLQWLRSYITRVVIIEINGKEFDEFTDEVIRTYGSYIEPTLKSTKNISSRTGKSLLHDEVPEDFVQVDNMHSLLFNEIFGILYNRLGELLFSIINEGAVSREKIKQLKNDYSEYFAYDRFSDVVQWDTADKRLKQADGFIRAFVKYDKNTAHSTFSFAHCNSIKKPLDLLPLTSLEIQWLSNILKHPLAKCFLKESEIGNILDRLGNVDLFDVNTLVLHDQYVGLEDFYKASNFGDSIQKIINAIRDNKMLTIKYKSQYGRQSNYVCSPIYIEYSKRDNRIRVRAVSKSNVAKTFNLERILDVAVMDETYNKAFAEDIIEKHIKDNECELIIFFNETKNVPDRILTEFSCFKKKCVKCGDERYRMTLYYNKEDKLEILVRLLSYGSQINVFDDTGDVRHELIERLEHQLELSNCMDLVFSFDFKEKE